MTRVATLVAIVLGVGAAVGVAAWATRKPGGARNWIAEQRVLPAVEVDGPRVTVRNARAFSYSSRSSFTPRYVDRTYDLDQLVSVWYVLSPFSTGWRGPAHSFVSFGFADSQFVSISVEARREVGEEYGVFRGLLRRFEIMYVIGDEADLIGQRAAWGQDRVYLYPVRTTPEKMRSMFLSMVNRANALRERPEFYNTLTNNCTSNVVAHVNEIAPGRVSTGLKTLLPGYSDEVAMQLGLIDTDLDIEKARERFLINDRAKRHFADPAFSLRIRGL